MFSLNVVFPYVELYISCFIEYIKIKITIIIIYPEHITVGADPGPDGEGSGLRHGEVGQCQRVRGENTYFLDNGANRMHIFDSISVIDIMSLTATEKLRHNIENIGDKKGLFLFNFIYYSISFT